MEVYENAVIAESTLSVYLDYKWKLSVAQIVVNLPHKFRTNTSFKVCRGGLDISNDSSHTEINFRGLKLVPPSCHSMQWTQPGELQMRIQAYKCDNGEKSRRKKRILSGDYEDFSSSGTSPGSSSSENDCDNWNIPMTKIKMICPVDSDVDTSMQCNMCGEIVVKSQRFSRILPLPTDNWQDLTGSWFCCQHNHSSGVDIEKPLVPRKGDCLYSDLCLVLHSSALYQPGVCRTEAGILNCTRCRNILGEQKKLDADPTDPPHAVLFRYQIIVKKASVISPTVDRQMWLKEFELGISSILLRQAEEQNCFRFIIESRSSTKTSPFLLIWLMDPNSVKYEGRVKFCSDHKEVITPSNVAKVIYKDCLNDTGIVSQWKKDLGAHCMALPETQCIQLLQLLTNRSQMIPLSLRLASDFFVSYLETCLPCPL